VWYYNKNDGGGGGGGGGDDNDDDAVLGPRILKPSPYKSESQFCSTDYAY